MSRVLDPLRVCIIASSRFPVREPFAGGLEAHTHALARTLAARGHEVTVFAADGSDDRLPVQTLLPGPDFRASDAARADVGAPPEMFMQEHHAYLSLMLTLAGSGRDRFDVVHNNSLHHLPVAMSGMLATPLVTTLHTPPTPWLESAIRFASPTSRFVAVSAAVARQWQGVVASDVILNGIDVDQWRVGPGGERAVWFGRIVPEKGPHLAIDAARAAGMPIDLAGPVFDEAYFRSEVEPRLGDDARLIGHLATDALAELVGRAAVTLVTPRWDEPYGLVAAESMASGTPVAAFARGGLVEVVSPDAGRVCAPDDVSALAAAIDEARRLPRDRVREDAQRRLTLDRMVDRYEALYRSLRPAVRAA